MIEYENSWAIPVERRSVRRTLVVGYWILMAICGSKLMLSANHPDLGWQISLQVMGLATLSLGGVKRGGLVRRFVAEKEESIELRLGKRERPWLDERESLLVSQVHNFAYRMAMYSAPGLLMLACIVAAVQPAWAERLFFLALLLLTVELWSLPQSILLWNEPDAEVEE